MHPSPLARRIAVAVGAALITAHLLGAAPAQNPPPGAARPPAPTGSGLILGTVVDAGSNKGVPGAVVSFSAMPASVAAAPVVPGRSQVIADDQGRFVFRDLPAGRYNFSASAQGYTRGGYGVRRPNGPSQPFELAEGAKVRDVTLRIWKFASIGGRVIDDAGEPVVQAAVTVFARESVAGRPRLRPAGNSARTDDRGVYRTPGLVPGDYVVGIVTSVSTMPASTAAGLNSLSGQARSDLLSQLLGGNSTMGLVLGLGANTYRVGDLTVQASSNGLTLPPPTADGRLLIYQTTFHPAATSPNTAGVITLTSGEDRRGIDLTVRLVPSVSVSGTLTGPDGPAGNTSVALLPPDARDVSSTLVTAGTATDAGGHFTFLGVPPGAYSVEATRVPRAPSTMTTTSVTVETPTGSRTMSSSRMSGPAPLPTEPTYFASRSLTVGDSNVANLDLQLRTAGRMSGRVEFDGTKDRPPANVLAQGFVSFVSTDGRPTARPRGQIDATGAFVTTGILPGRYVLSIPTLPPGWTARSAMWRGHDLLDEPLDADGSDIIGVVITFSDRAAQITGAVHDAQSRGDGTATVLFFTSAWARWAGAGGPPRLFRSARVTSAGGYTIAGIPPGDYYILAADDASIGDWQDPKRLDAAARAGTRITIAEGDQRSLDLKTVVIR